jgi:hypothetical protein
LSCKLSKVSFGKPAKKLPCYLLLEEGFGAFKGMKVAPAEGFWILANLQGFLTSLRFAKKMMEDSSLLGGD